MNLNWQSLRTSLLQELSLPLLLLVWVLVRLLSLVEKKLQNGNLYVSIAGKEIIEVTDKRSHIPQEKEKTPVTEESDIQKTINHT